MVGRETVETVMIVLVELSATGLKAAVLMRWDSGDDVSELADDHRPETN